MNAMHDFTATTIATRKAVVDILLTGTPIIVHLESGIGTYLSDTECDEIMAALYTLIDEIPIGTDAEIREARRILTDRAYEAQDAIEVDAL